MASSLSVNFVAGSQHAITAADPAALKFERTDEFSFFIWCTREAAATQGIFSKYDNALGRGILFRYDTNGRIELFIANGAANRINIRTLASVFDGFSTTLTSGWRHLGFTHGIVGGGSAASDAILYIDGYAHNAEVVEDTLSATIDHTVNFQISGRDGAAGVELQASADEMTIYDAVVTPANALLHYNGGEPVDPTVIGQTGDLLEWWPLGEGDTFPTLAATQTTPGHDLTMTNMLANDIEAEVPFAINLLDEDFLEYEDVVFVGGVAGGAVTTFKMRGRDDGRTPGSDYITWTSATPDFAGAGFPTGDPTPIGSLIAGSVVKVADLTGT